MSCACVCVSCTWMEYSPGYLSHRCQMPEVGKWATVGRPVKLGVPGSGGNKPTV